MSQLINFMCSLITLFVINSNTSTQELTQNEKISTPIEGKWEGNLVINENKSIGIMWRFETSEEGKIIGFMGPASKGVATIPMQDLFVTNTKLNFSIHSQGNFSGLISESGINGIFNTESGKQLVLYMARELSQEQLRKRYDKSSNGDKVDFQQEIALGNVEAVKTFLSNGNAIDSLYGKGTTLLFTAIKKDRTHKIAKYLLENGANPNLVTDDLTPLMYAVAYQNAAMVKELIAYKADVNFISKEKQSALVFAIKGRNAEILQLLMDGGADPSLHLKDDYSAIDLAKEENIKEILEILNIPYEGVSDGPYVMQSETGRTAIWVYKGETHTQEINSQDSQIIEYNGVKAKLWNNTPKEVKQLAYNGNFKIGAVSDIHGQYDTFIKLLKNNGVIDNQGKWSFGNGHFVVAGDMFDRGPQVTEVLWFLYDLEKQAEEKGGKLHVLLGNHDVMVLNGNLRSVHPKYTEIAKILETPFNTFFNKGTVLGDWLRTRPVLIKLNDILFTHGGLHPDLVEKGLSIEEINSEFKQQLVASELVEKRNELGEFLHRANGPIYYRGYFQGELTTDGQIDELLKHFKISNIVVGHTTHKEIEMHFDGRVIVIDANMKSGTMGEMLLWQEGAFTRGNLLGEELPLKISETQK
ncbi:ankyrin repeat domain-containing protein [Psychroserpens jangbogonensis]|uniref:ankyrin repeat domain-containing protein n=1 Tax=Psychroserpens jangbogonensis TaxID=1484460 RepID=UPI00068B8A98|nr:ankyrin repeat domain-containing protein [Psychroserpens jangbogonensis]